MAEASAEIEKYFKEIEEKLNQAYKIADAARKKGLDPEEHTDIPLARDMAERVQGIISAVAPQLVGLGIIKRINELEKKYGALDWRVALVIADEVASEKFCKFKNKLEAMEVGIRAGFTYHTLGIVSAPLEGFTELKIKKRRDGKEYFAAKFAGPIRGAGGTAAAFSLLIADYVRKKNGYDPYDPDDLEVERYITELDDYHERVTNLQYHAGPEQLQFLIKHLPVEVDGDPTEKFEVSKNKDLPRIETNRIRGGVALVVSMLALKGDKLWKELSKWGKDFGLDDWNFLEQFIKIKKREMANIEKPAEEKKDKEKSEETTETTAANNITSLDNKEDDKGEKKEEKKDEKKILPNFTYIADLVAGRPVLSYPMRFGGFRLRYGRSRLSGYSATAIHPATMLVLKKYIATGTQLKIERPGKATAVTPCDTIEGPIVRLDDDSVMKLNSENDARNLAPRVREILFIGDMLISYGDFLDRAHMLIPAGYTEEQYAKELEKAIVNTFGSMDLDKLSEFTGMHRKIFEKILKNPFSAPDTKTAIMISEKLGLALHPAYTHYWTGITKEQLRKLIEWFREATIREETVEERKAAQEPVLSLEKLSEAKSFDKEEKDEKKHVKKIILPSKKEEKRILEIIGLPHKFATEFVIIEKDEADIFLRIFPLLKLIELESAESPKVLSEINKEMQIIEDSTNVLEALNTISAIKIKDKAGCFIGARMGRPEKAKMRQLIGSPHALFPIGDEGGKMRSFQAAMDSGKVTAELPLYKCVKCDTKTIFPICEKCNEPTKKLYFCDSCGELEKPNCPHNSALPYKTQIIDINYYMSATMSKLGIKVLPDLIKGVRGTSNKEHIPEHLAKGILRAKYELCVNKDGTTRYDMTELPVTHFRAAEIGTPIEKLKELGYTKDINGMPLENDEQLLELKPQDVILPGAKYSMDEPADEVLFRISKFIDELLVNFYGLEPFYNLKSKEDLIGCLVIGLAPHISAGIIGRIIGFSNTQGCFAHPLWHAAHRRDCDGDENCVMLLMDALLNFSRKFLPDKRGSRTMDSPLVLTSKIVPAEVDDMVHKLDIMPSYPLEFYEACEKYLMPWDIKIETLGSRLGTEKQYEEMCFTHDVKSMNEGVTCSAYKTIPSMEEKLVGQMKLAEMITAVDEADVARLVIEKHFMKDIKGNLRKFSMQQFRCVKCNAKYRRPPLIGICTACGGKLMFTVSKGFVLKYLEPSISLAKKYNVPEYLKHSLELVKRRVEGVFGKEKEKQEALGKWFG